MSQILCPYHHNENSRHWDWDFPCRQDSSDPHYVDSQEWLMWLTDKVIGLSARLEFAEGPRPIVE